jgi:7-cyano-7-deazaguanine synthase in queuosine biosynthesis
MKIVVKDPKTVVLWSGGVDSTGVLYNILKDYPDEVFAHHIHFKNRENRWEAEKESVDKMIPWLRKNVRDFDYSESTFEIDLRFVGWDVIIMEVILLFQQIEQLQ